MRTSRNMYVYNFKVYLSFNFTKYTFPTPPYLSPPPSPQAHLIALAPSAPSPNAVSSVALETAVLQLAQEELDRFTQLGSRYSWETQKQVGVRCHGMAEVHCCMKINGQVDY